MAVIKRQQASGLLKEAVVLDLGDIARQAARIEAAAQVKARQIEQTAQQRAAQLTEHASAEGFERGRVAGMTAGTDVGRREGREEAFEAMTAQLEQLRQSWLDAAHRWEEHRRMLESEAPQAVLELALRLTEKIVHRIVQIDDEVVLDQVRAALTHALGDHAVTARVAPEDGEVVQTALPKLTGELAQSRQIDITVDETVPRGGCIISFGQGQVDATLETQLRRAVELLLPDPETGAAAEASPGQPPVGADADDLVTAQVPSTAAVEPVATAQVVAEVGPAAIDPTPDSADPAP